MATERLQIEVSETGTRTVKRSVQDIGASALKSAGPVNELKGVLSQLTASVRQVNTTLTSMQATLAGTRSAMSGSASAVGQLQQQLNVNYSTTLRAAQATQQLNASLKQTDAATKVTSGATTQLNTALRQTSGTVGSASGAVRGLSEAERQNASAALAATNANRSMNQELNRTASATSVANRGYSLLRNTIVAVLGSLVARKVIEFSDAFTSIQNRLRLVTNDTANLNAVYRELFNVSRDTRSGFQANVELFSRVALATKELGVSQQEVINFTKSLNQAIKLSGTTSVEAEAGLVQLSQGLASGTLRGDELRSVLEQLPAVADVIAKGLGVTRGELRKLGEEGKINAGVILKAFREAREELNDKFAKTLPTIGEGFVILKNQLIDTIGVLGNASGATAGLGGALQGVAEFIKEGTPEIANFIRALRGTLDPMDQLTSGSKVFASIFVTVIGVLQLIAKTLKTTVVGAFNLVGRTVGGVTAAIVQALKGNFAEAGRILKTNFIEDNLLGSIDAAKDLGAELVATTSGTIEKLAQIWNSGSRLIQDRKDKVVGEVGQVATSTPRAAGLSAEELKAIERQREFIAGLQQEAEELRLTALAGDNAAAVIKLYQTEVAAAALGGEAFVAQAKAIAASINEQNAAIELQNKIRGDDELIGTLQEELELSRLSNRERAIEIELRKLSTEATDEQRAKIAELAGAIFDQEERLKSTTEVMKALTEAAAENIQSAFADFLFNPFEDGLKGMLRSFIDTLRRMAAEALANHILRSLFGALSGSSNSFLSTIGKTFGAGLTGRAAGGTVQANRPYVVGERGPELHVPPRTGTIVPNGRLSAAAPNITLRPQIINVRDPKEIPTIMQSGAGAEAMINVFSENISTFRQILQQG